MGKELYELRDMLMDELSKISGKGELTAGSLETVDKLTHSIKSIDTICAMEEAGGYSNDGSYNSYNRSYNRGYNRSYDGSYAMRDRRGRYSRMGGYSGHEELVDNLRELMEHTTDNKSRSAIQRAIEQMEA